MTNHMRNLIFDHHSVGLSLSDNNMLAGGFFASISADSFGSQNYESANAFSLGVSSPSTKDIPMWLVLSTALLAKDQEYAADDYQDPEYYEILDTMFPDPDDDFWNDN